VCSVRADRVDTETCELLKRMNTRWVTLGVESASDRVLALMNKRTNVKQILQALRLLRHHGIEVEACFILGYPGETVKDMKATVAFIEENFGTLFRDFSLFPLVLFPGTRVWEEAVRGGLIDENFDPESINRSTNNFNPDRYVFLNSHVPRDTFLYYVYTVRERLRRSSRNLNEASEFQGKLLGQIDAMSLEMDEASRHLAKLEEELSHEKERIAMLEQGRRDQKNSLKRFLTRGSGR